MSSDQTYKDEREGFPKSDALDRSTEQITFVVVMHIEKTFSDEQRREAIMKARMRLMSVSGVRSVT